jgi:hypothetical protein
MTLLDCRLEIQLLGGGLLHEFRAGIAVAARLCPGECNPVRTADGQGMKKAGQVTLASECFSAYRFNCAARVPSG